MNEHLTEWDMRRYAEICSLTPENVEFVAWANCHVFECERCRQLLERVCEQTAPLPPDGEMKR